MYINVYKSTIKSLISGIVYHGILTTLTFKFLHLGPVSCFTLKFSMTANLSAMSCREIKVMLNILSNSKHIQPRKFVLRLYFSRYTDLQEYFF